MSEHIPEGWKKVKLGEVATLHYGKSLPEKRRIKGNVPVYSSAGITGWHNEAIVKSKGIIVGRKGTIGKVYLSEVPFYPIDTCYYVLPEDNKYHFKYIYYSLINLELDKLNEDSAVPGLNRNTAYLQDFLLPPLPEQKAIASVLSSLDDKIDLLHRQNKTLEQMAETLFRQWFIEEKEEGWEEVKLGELIELQRGVSYSGKKLGYDGQGLPMHNMNSISVDGSYKFEGIKYYTGEVKDKQILKPGDLLIINTDITQENRIIGWPIFVPEKFEKSICSHHLYSASLITNKVSKLYLYFLLRNRVYRFELANSANGTTVSMLSKKAILNLKLKIPPLEKRLRFERIAYNLIDKQTENQKQIQTLEKLRDTLLPKLMNGEVRVEYEREKEKTQSEEDFISRHIEESVEPWPINNKFREAVLFSGVVAVMSDEKFAPDRVRVTKAEYLAKRYMGMDVLGEYSKMAAGPYDPAIRYKGPEKIAKKNGYVEAVRSTQFRKGPKFQDAEKYLEKYGYKPALEWLERFKYMKNKELELLATVDYAALDLMRQGKDVSVESVIEYIRADEEWKKKLEEKADVFNKEKVKWALEELKGVFPKTYGG